MMHVYTYRDIVLIKIAEGSMRVHLLRNHVHGVMFFVAYFSPGIKNMTTAIHNASSVAVVSV